MKYIPQKMSNIDAVIETVTSCGANVGSELRDHGFG